MALALVAKYGMVSVKFRLYSDYIEHSGKNFLDIFG
jgi:hypothetical protein